MRFQTFYRSNCRISVQSVDNRFRALLANTSSRVWRLSADLGLDGIELLDARERLPIAIGDWPPA